MKLLLDTHTFLWFILGDPKLSTSARTRIEDPSNDKLLSVASLWEIAIKSSLGKLTLTQPFDILIPREVHNNGFHVLAITLDHLAAVTTLPFHHRDPFDRLMVAQAMVERLPIVSRDSTLDAYSITRLW
jgi:PIN domain nuclease of toxin-antitoxin system